MEGRGFLLLAGFFALAPFFCLCVFDVLCVPEGAAFSTASDSAGAGVLPRGGVFGVSDLALVWPFAGGGAFRSTAPRPRLFARCGVPVRESSLVGTTDESLTVANPRVAVARDSAALAFRRPGSGFLPCSRLPNARRLSLVSYPSLSPVLSALMSVSPFDSPPLTLTLAEPTDPPSLESESAPSSLTIKTLGGPCGTKLPECPTP